MRLFNFLGNKSTSRFDDLQKDIIECLGKSLKDKEFTTFIKKYHIKVEDKHNMKLFHCSNKFLEFENRDQRRQTINEIKITNNADWLPFEIKQEDTFGMINSRLGNPDIIDYRYNVGWYYDKLVIIKFDNIQDYNSGFVSITFNNHLRVKPNAETIGGIQMANDQFLKDIEDKSFGQNSKWIIVKSNEEETIASLFGATELSNWRNAFAHCLNFHEKGNFITKIENYGILVCGWGLPDIVGEIDFYRKLSFTYGEIFYFANHIKSTFSWARFRKGETIRAYSEEYLKSILDIGELLALEKKSSTRRSELLHAEEEYDSDQDIRKAYRQFMSSIVLEVAKEWVFDPRELSKFKLKEKVFLNLNY